MRVLISLLLIAYLVGVGVMLAPTIKANWTAVPASQFVDVIVAELPKAFSWPVTAYRRLADETEAPATATPEKPVAPEKPAQ